MAGQHGLQRFLPCHLLRQFGIGLNRSGDLRLVFARQFAIGKRGDVFGGNRHDASPSIAISASRPRTRRELSVPTGQPTISAASL